MSKELVEAGLALATSPQSGSDYATEHLDRTIYYTTYVTDSEGRVMVDSNGDKIVRNQALYLAGSYISKPELELALETESTFKKLNDALRKKMEAEGLKWRVKKSDQKALVIQGVTGI